ncbi:MAG: hypothetical protein Q8867_02590 [Bacteroidota bacterium]|nr:hypothetical protein [Bacteroidota bacterium]
MMKRTGLLGLLLIILLLPSCKKNTDIVSYHTFPNRSWYRYSIQKFVIPIKNIEKPYDVSFFARFTQEYPFDNLNFNMVMTTPSGEERIMEYPFTIKRDGHFTGTFVNDSCEASVCLKKGIQFDKAGILIIEIENLVPRLQTPGLLGVGIRLTPKP